MFNLESLGKIHVSKGNTQKRMPFPHAFTFSSSLMFWGAAIRFDHPSFMFSVFFPCFACPVHHVALTKTLWSILIVLYSILCMHNVRSSCLQKHVLFGVICLLFRSSVLLSNGILCHRVSGSLFYCVGIVVCCVCIFSLV